MIAPTLETVSGGELMSRRQVVYWLVGTILALIALGGLVLWWPPRAPANASNLLGTALLGATIVALALLVSEYLDRKSTRLNSSHLVISYAVFCLKKKKDQ